MISNSISDIILPLEYQYNIYKHKLNIYIYIVYIYWLIDLFISSLKTDNDINKRSYKKEEKKQDNNLTEQQQLGQLEKE